MTCHTVVKLGMMPTVIVDSKGPWMRLSLSPWIISSEFHSRRSMSGGGSPARRTWSPARLTGNPCCVWPSGRHHSFPSASSFPPGSWPSCPPLGYWDMNFTLPLEISSQPHLWLPPYPGPAFHLQMALKKRKPGREWPKSFFLIMSTFLLLPGSDLAHQSLQLDEQAD